MVHNQFLARRYSIHILMNKLLREDTGDIENVDKGGTEEIVELRRKKGDMNKGDDDRGDEGDMGDKAYKGESDTGIHWRPGRHGRQRR